jgi:hypothetical protein
MNNTNKGRKSIQYKEIIDREFTIADLLQLNVDVKAPSIRSYVKKNIQIGRYVIVGSYKTGKRGKPSFKYSISKNQDTADSVVNA